MKKTITLTDDEIFLIKWEINKKIKVCLEIIESEKKEEIREIFEHNLIEYNNLMKKLK